MATRPAWTVNNNIVVKNSFDFTWNGGFAVVQKQKNIVNLHKSIKTATGQKALEISSKGQVQVGRDLSAFIMRLDGLPVENHFQSAKVYEHGGPYKDLLSELPKDAKRDERHKNSGKLIGFEHNNVVWTLEPQTAFYDWLFIRAMVQNYGTELNLYEYDWFTDIEFNPKKSVNCQARAVAIYKLLQEIGRFELLNNKEEWLSFHRTCVKG